MINVSKVVNEEPMTEEEGYELTKYYVHYFWSVNKYYSLKNQYEEGDILSEVYLKFMRHSYFKKYDYRVTTKKYFIMRGVQTTIIDLLRKYRETYSLDKENENGTTHMDILEDETISVEKKVEGEVRRKEILDKLPEKSDSKIKGYSTLLNKEVNISYRVLAQHLEAGYRPKDLAQMYKNPETGENVSEGTITSYIRKLREYALDNIVLE